MKWPAPFLSIAALLPGTASARDLCPDRPGLGTPPCIVDRGRVVAETALADWTRDDSPDAREDQLLIGDTLVRIGVSDTAEVQVGWTPFGHDYLRDRATGTTSRTNRIGDVMLGAKISLVSPDGTGVSIALQPGVTLPVGRQPIGAGDWGAQFVVPVSVALDETFSLQASPEVDAAVDEDGRGRHVAWGSVVGLGIKLSRALSGAVEMQAIRDDDPAGRTTQVLAALSLAWQPADDWQFDIGGAAGMTHDTPDARLYAGVTRRF